MALNIKNPKVEALAEEVSRMTGESKTEAIRKALEERKHRLEVSVPPGMRYRRLLEILERDIWPLVPADVLGKRLTREEEDAILGFGDRGV